MRFAYSSIPSLSSKDISAKSLSLGSINILEYVPLAARSAIALLTALLPASSPSRQNTGVFL